MGRCYLSCTSKLNADNIKSGTIHPDRLPEMTGGNHTHDNLTILDGDQESFTNTLKNQYDGYASGKEPANANIQIHVTSIHAPINAQKNSDITKGEIEAKLVGEISTHSHAGGGGGLSQAQVLTRML